MIEEVLICIFPVPVDVSCNKFIVMELRNNNSIRVCSKIPPVVQHKEDRSSGSSVQDHLFGKHGTSPEGKFELLLLRFFHFYQIESRQIFQNGCIMNLRT